MIISIGAFADPAFANRLEQAAKESGRRIYLPSGAIGGLDVLKAAALDGGLDSVTLTTRKPAHSLTADKITAEQILFEGPARDAIEQFPKMRTWPSFYRWQVLGSRGLMSASLRSPRH